MDRFFSILFWLGIVFMMDGSLALLFHEKWQKRVNGLNIQRIAWIEIGASLVLLGGYYVLLLNRD